MAEQHTKTMYHTPTELDNAWRANPKRHAAQKAKELGLFDGMAMISRHFGMLQSCQIEEVRSTTEISTQTPITVVEVVAGYQHRDTLVIRKVLSLPLATHVSTRKAVRVYHSANEIHFLEDNANDTRFIYKYEPFIYRLGPSITPSTGY
jgi:hypothetical protein